MAFVSIWPTANSHCAVPAAKGDWEIESVFDGDARIPDVVVLGIAQPCEPVGLPIHLERPARRLDLLCLLKQKGYARVKAFVAPLLHLLVQEIPQGIGE